MPPGLSIREKLYFVKECGFDFMEISIDETDEKLSRLDYSEEEINDIINAMTESNVYIRTMCLSGHRRFPLGSHDESIRRRSLDIMQKAVEFSYRLGIRIIQLAGYDVYYEQSDETTRKLFNENLQKCVSNAALKGIMLGFETMETPFMDTVEKSMKYVKQAGSPYLGVYPDVGNLQNAAVLYGHDIVDDIQKGRGHIFAAHLKETKPGVYRDMQFGTGHTQYERCVKALYDMGVRIFTGEFWYMGEDDFKRTLYHANDFLRNKIEKAISA
ncbi:MAG TPA: L-ribulose-5-phosphate 3-epimerase [Clostridiales bacterium]|nr:L-ribulose-5-phosphate 3-epimerase [Clostridiales bacterium]